LPRSSRPERRAIDRTLGVGKAPRSIIIRRYDAGPNRRALQRRRDEGHHEREKT
jgi:hypothetical protein